MGERICQTTTAAEKMSSRALSNLCFSHLEQCFPHRCPECHSPRPQRIANERDPVGKRAEEKSGGGENRVPSVQCCSQGVQLRQSSQTRLLLRIAKHSIATNNLSLSASATQTPCRRFDRDRLLLTRPNILCPFASCVAAVGDREKDRYKGKE